jgi:hypothetical protein
MMNILVLSEKQVRNTVLTRSAFLLLIGLSRYSQNLGLLVPFFDSPSLELENIEKVATPFVDCKSVFFFQ